MFKVYYTLQEKIAETLTEYFCSLYSQTHIPSEKIESLTKLKKSKLFMMNPMQHKCTDSEDQMLTWKQLSFVLVKTTNILAVTIFKECKHKAWSPNCSPFLELVQICEIYKREIH